MSTPIHAVGIHANHVSRTCKNEQVQAVLQWVGVGSVIMMGLAAAVHLVKDLFGAPKFERYSRAKHEQMLEDLDRHYRSRERVTDRGR